MKKAVLKIAVVMVLAMLVLGACGDGGSALVGRWTSEPRMTPGGVSFISTYDFFPDGVGDAGGTPMTWSVDGNRLVTHISGTLTHSAESRTYTFQVSGNTLILTPSPSGEPINFTRSN